MTIDLRSDTLTRPTEGMLKAMFQAEVGDDVFGDDPSINALEARVAELFGQEAAVFCPSGTMCNQIAIRIATRPQDQMICYESAHVYLYEGGGAAYNSGVTAKLLPGDMGRLKAADVEAAINADDVHFPRTSLVCIENTVNKGGGSCYELEEVKKIRKVCDQHGLHLHLDGARFFNAVVEKGYTPADFGALCDTLSICFSKGLGAPVGSVLIGSKALIKEARRVRKVFGGGMRQAGYLAAAASYALDHHVHRLADDHRRARRLGEVLAAQPWVKRVVPVETNIVIFEPTFSPAEILQKLEALDIKAVPFGAKAVRLVTHLDISEEMIEAFAQRIEGVKGKKKFL
jgi:threonine aldolase